MRRRIRRFFLLAAPLILGLAGRPNRANAADSAPPHKKIWNAELYDRWISEEIESARALRGEALGGLTVRENERELLLAADGTSVPKDMDRVCPRFGSLPVRRKLEFWSHFFQALAYAESGYDERMVYREKWSADDSGDSVGLLQLSTGDNEAYGCGFTGRGPLAPRDPHENLACGVRIMAVQLALCGTLFQGLDASTACRGKTAHGTGADSSFYFAALNPKDASGPEGFRATAAQWKKMTGWDLVKTKRAGGAGAAFLPDCY